MDSTEDVAVGELPTPVGRISVAVTGIGLMATGWRPFRGDTFGGLRIVHDPPRLAGTLGRLSSYFQNRLTDFGIPIDWRLTKDSQRQVLQALHETVPFGKSVTYGELAERSGTGVPARGIGAIMGSNPIPIVVPCHRVLSHDGLGGYSGGDGRNGLEVKRWLLALEGVLPPTLDWSPDGL